MPTEVFVAFEDGSVRSFSEDGDERLRQPWRPRNDAMSFDASPSSRSVFVKTRDDIIAKIDVSRSSVTATFIVPSNSYIFASLEMGKIYIGRVSRSLGNFDYTVLRSGDLMPIQEFLATPYENFVYSARTGAVYGSSAGASSSRASFVAERFFSRVDLSTMRSLEFLQIPIPVKTSFTSDARAVADERIESPPNQCDVAILDFDIPGGVRAYLYDGSGRFLRNSGLLSVVWDVAQCVGGDPAQIYLGCQLGVASTSFRNIAQSNWSSYFRPSSGHVVALGTSRDHLFVLCSDGLFKVAFDLSGSQRIASFSSLPSDMRVANSLFWSAELDQRLHRAMRDLSGVITVNSISREAFEVLSRYSAPATKKDRSAGDANHFRTRKPHHKISNMDVVRHLAKFHEDINCLYQFYELNVETGNVGSANEVERERK